MPGESLIAYAILLITAGLYRPLIFVGGMLARYSWRSCRSSGVLLGSPPISRASFGTI